MKKAVIFLWHLRSYNRFGAHKVVKVPKQSLTYGVDYRIKMNDSKNNTL